MSSYRRQRRSYYWGISFTLLSTIKAKQYEQEYVLSDTMQRLMLTATDEQIVSYETHVLF